jgi:glucokinase
VRRAGIDVGGTKFLGVVIDASGDVVAEVRRPTPVGEDALLQALTEVAEALGPWDSIGVGMPGLVNRDGVIRSSPHLPGVTDFDLRSALGKQLGRSIAVDNDATCAALAEWRVGAGRGSQDLVMVTLGTGVGGGIVADGRLVRGCNGFAGEFGHMVVDPDGLECPCGRRGCWERYAAGTGLAQLARTATLLGRGAVILALAGGDPSAIRGEHVQQAARGGDPDALAIIEDFGRWVAIGLVNLANTLDPERFVLGGGVAATPELYIGSITRWFSSLLYAPDHRPHPVVTFASLGERAGAVGAALLSSER